MSNTRKATGKTATPEPAPSLDTLLGEDSRPERVVPICLRGHLQAEWDQLKAAYDAGPGDEDRAMLTDRAAKRKVADQMAEVEQRMRAGTVAFRLRALPRLRGPDLPAEALVWSELFDKHPPRRDAKGKVDPRDAATGCNTLALLEELVPASIVEPAVTPEQWAKLNTKLNDGQWNQLATACWELNRSEVDVPFSRAASIMRRLGIESRRQNDSESPSDASTDGNPSESPSTSTTTTDG